MKNTLWIIGLFLFAHTPVLAQLFGEEQVINPKIDVLFWTMMETKRC